jgi:CHASE2 domain-containing sensor protein
MTELRKTTRERLREHLTPKRLANIFITLFLVGVVSYNFEEIKNLFPDLVTLQLYVYSRITRIANPAPQRNWVVPVEIDDEAFFKFLHLGEQDVTDRGFLADLVDAAVKARAAVIALDINLVVDGEDSSEQCRREGNRAFFDAIARANARSIPVILTQGFDYKTSIPLENIRDRTHTANEVPSTPKDQNPPSPPHCTSDDKPAPKLDPVVVIDCQRPPDEKADPNRYQAYQQAAANPFGARAGFDLAPEDRRKVPLITYTNHDVECKSFALQTAEAFNTVMHWPPIMPRLDPKTDQGQQFVYAEILPEFSHQRAESDASLLSTILDKIDTKLGFTREADRQDTYQLTHLNARTVYDNRNDEQWLTDNMAHRIVLIGGHRHAHADDQGNPIGDDWVDYHIGPSGPMAGMYVHANYIQSLLDNHTLYPISRGWGVVIDLGIAAFVIGIELVWVERRWQRYVIIVLGAVLLLLTHKVVTAFQVGALTRLGIYLLIVLAIWRVGFHAETRKRVVTLLLAMIVIVMAYVTATLMGFGLDLLAVTVILIAHDLYDRHLQKQEHHAELAGGTHA